MATINWGNRAARMAILGGALALVLVTTACGGGDDGGGGGDGDGASATTAAPAGGDDDLYVVITNSEGIASPGLDAIVQTAYQHPKTTIAVVVPNVEAATPPAPLAGGQAPDVLYTPTPSGFPGVVVAADAADTVRTAIAGNIDGLPEGQTTPDLVIAGINTGQLIGSLADFSSNVPAAQAAVDAGVPALVVAQGVDQSPPEYAAGVTQAITWIEDHRDALLAGDEPAQVYLLNVPSCTAAQVRGLVEVPVAADDAGRDLAAVDCTSTAEGPADDVAAFTTGFATVAVLPAADPTTSTTATAGGEAAPTTTPAG